MNPVIRILYLSGILDHPGIQYEPKLYRKSKELERGGFTPPYRNYPIYKA
jgi:hypothetical protein